MATRSTIAYITKEGTVKSIYAHWDGYPSNNGKLLKEKHNTLEEIEKVVAGGDLSSLAELRYYAKRNEWDKTLVEGDQVENWENIKPLVYENEKSYKKRLGREEYNYLFKNGEWYFSKGESKRLNKLTDKVIEND